MPDAFLQDNGAVKIEALNIFYILITADKKQAFALDRLKAFKGKRMHFKFSDTAVAHNKISYPPAFDLGFAHYSAKEIDFAAFLILFWIFNDPSVRRNMSRRNLFDHKSGIRRLGG
jgi:hypothetical protein